MDSEADGGEKELDPEEVQKELTITAYPFEFEVAHWARLAFMRATLRVHLRDAGKVVTNDDGTKETVPKEYWTYLDECLKAAKADHVDHGQWVIFVRNVLECDLAEHSVGSQTPKTVNEPLQHRSAAQQETELAE
ncbi:hypothetical protein CALCODRAFT_480526 [Calocera cornea HHB12733]|uniref:Uncharacterized protein n=1 Tax=Calocera cornea HHB12733 TaxID=1353952 RepID=A0A165IIW6_9BASI|nr:hypothetical protein CALCODRAFT_480526 [Calocera cornea HHB12733]